MQREKKTISGPLLEADFYPIYSDGRQISRGPKVKKSTVAQQKYNRAKAKKKAVRDINANFDKDDLLITVTYDAASAPQTEEEAERNMINFRRRIKDKRISELKRYKKLYKEDPKPEYKKIIKVLEKPFKFYYRTERTDYKSGKYAGRCNWHYHLFITGGLDRDTVEDMWPYMINADRFRPDKFGPEAAAKYAAKPAEQDNEKIKIHHSRNLTPSVVPKPKDGRITKRGVEMLCKIHSEDREYWEKRYKGYRFIRSFPRFNNYNGNWYLTVIMYKIENTKLKASDFNFDGWTDDDEGQVKAYEKSR